MEYPTVDCQKAGREKYQPIQNLRPINSHVEDIHSTVLNPYNLLSMMNPNRVWYAVLDLKDAFFCLRLHPSSQALFSFEWNDFCNDEASPRWMSRERKPGLCLRCGRGLHWVKDCFSLVNFENYRKEGQNILLESYLLFPLWKAWTFKQKLQFVFKLCSLGDKIFYTRKLEKGLVPGPSISGTSLINNYASWFSPRKHYCINYLHFTTS